MPIYHKSREHFNRLCTIILLYVYMYKFLPQLVFVQFHHNFAETTTSTKIVHTLVHSVAQRSEEVVHMVLVVNQGQSGYVLNKTGSQSVILIAAQIQDYCTIVCFMLPYVMSSFFKKNTKRTH